MQTKICTKCGRELPKNIDYFRPKKNRGKVSFSPQCRDCEREYRVKRYLANRERFVEYSREYRKKHSRYSVKPKTGYKICGLCGGEFPATLEYFRKKQSGKNGLTGRCRKCLGDINKKYYEDNKEAFSRKVNEWKLKNRDKVKEISKGYQQRRRSKMKKIQYSLSVKEWQQIKDFFNHCCAYCGKPSKRLTQEHFIPVSRHGEYTKHNIIPACLSCNSSKNNKSFEEWYPEQPFYSKDRERFICEHFAKMAQENGGWGRSRPDLGVLTIAVNNEWGGQYLETVS